MYKKICNRCTRNSFSSSESGEWICPSCGNDLTQLPLYGVTFQKSLFDEKRQREKVIGRYKQSSQNLQRFRQIPL
jgi:ribosomal protein L37AE/L43A